LNQDGIMFRQSSMLTVSIPLRLFAENSHDYP